MNGKVDAAEGKACSDERSRGRARACIPLGSDSHVESRGFSCTVPVGCKAGARERERMNIAQMLSVVMLVVASAAAAAQGWSPQKNVEIVAASAPGGSNDNTARMLERILSSGKIVNSTV